MHDTCGPQPEKVRNHRSVAHHSHFNAKSGGSFFIQGSWLISSEANKCRMRPSSRLRGLETGRRN